MRTLRVDQQHQNIDWTRMILLLCIGYWSGEFPNDFQMNRKSTELMKIAPIQKFLGFASIVDKNTSEKFQMMLRLNFIMEYKQRKKGNNGDF